MTTFLVCFTIQILQIIMYILLCQGRTSKIEIKMKHITTSLFSAVNIKTQLFAPRSTIMGNRLYIEYKASLGT